MSLNVQRSFDGLEKGFSIEDLPIPAGLYDWTDTRVSYRFGPQRKVSGFLSVSSGGFYGGTRRQIRYNGRVEFTSQLSVEPVMTLSWLDLPSGNELSKLIGARTSYTFTPRMFLGALIQYSTAAESLSTNIRYSWEF